MRFTELRWILFVVQAEKWILAKIQKFWVCIFVPTWNFALNLLLYLQAASSLIFPDSSMYENWKCFKFHDVTLTWILGFVFIFASNCYQTASLFVPGGHFNKKNNDFWALGKSSNVICEVSYWYKKITIGRRATNKIRLEVSLKYLLWNWKFCG